MKVIFLDVDGVLNSEHWYKVNYRRHPERCRVETAIDPRFVRNLKRIVDKTGAKIVLSATCRGAVKKKRNHYLRIILKKYQPSCIFCGNADEITYFKGKLICRDCLKSLKIIAD